MSKKGILSALLMSSALLGTTVVANAATSALQPESKLVSVEKDGVKIYKNSKLEESKEVAKGTVYKVNGFRDINNKKYYRVYQQNTEGKNVYKGYILAKDAPDLKAGSVDKKDRFVGLTENGQKAWDNLYFNREIKTYNGKKHSSNFEVKCTYEIGGKKYFSLYRGEKWMGYMDGSAFKVLTPENIEEGKQAYVVSKDAKTYNDIYFTPKGELKAGEEVTVKRVYTFGTGRKYASAYNAEGKWVGYVNLSFLSENKVVDEETQKAIDAANDAIKKAEDILSKAQASKASKEAAQKVIDNAKETIKNGNLDDIKKIPAQIKEAIEALKPGATTIDVQRVEEAIAKGEEAIKQITASGVGSVDKPKVEAVKKAVDEAKKVLEELKKGDASSEDADKAVEDINKAVDALGFPATSVDVENLQHTIKEAKAIYNGTNGIATSGREELNKEIEKAEQVLKDAKAGNATAKDVDNEITALGEAMNNVKLNKKALSDKVQSVQKLASTVYMTKTGEDKFVKAMTDIMNMPDTGVHYADYQKAQDILVEAEKGLEKQPTEKEGKPLADVVKEAQKLEKYGDVFFEGFDGVKQAYDVANKDLTELKKDTKKSNTATVELTAADITKATTDLQKALESLKINKANTEWFYNEANKAIKSLNKDDQTKAKEALKAFEEAAKKGTAKDFKEIVEAANKVVNTINDAQNKELQAEIDKAKQLLGTNNENESHYTKRSVAALKSALEDGEKAVKLPLDKINKDNMHDKQSSIIALRAAIKGLKLDAAPIVKKVKDAADSVYLTKDQEASLDKFLKKVVNTPISVENKQQLEKLNKELEQIKTELAKQPDKAIATKAVKLDNAVKDLAKLPNKGTGLTNIDAVKTPFEKLDKEVTSIKKDKKGDNQADVVVTKEQLQKDMDALQKALDGVTINETAFKTFDDAAKALAAQDSALTSTDAKLQSELEAFEKAAQDNKLSNLGNIMAAGQKVYDTMLQDLGIVLQGAAKWNDGQYTNDPSVAKTASAKKLTLNVKAAQASAVAGQSLTQQQFAKWIETQAPKVSNYYQAGTYTAFGTAIEKAAQTLQDAKAHKSLAASGATGAEAAVNTAKVGAQINAEMKALQTTQAALKFDKAALMNLVTQGQNAKNTWVTTQNKVVTNGKKDDVTEQGKAANQGFYQLKTWLGTQQNSIDVNDENTKQVITLVYNAVNGYYQYCETVTVDSNGTVTPKAK